MRRNQQWRDPLESMLKIDRAVAGIVERHRTDVLHLFSAFIVTNGVTFTVRINDMPVARVWNYETAFAVACRIPILRTDDSRIGPARDANVRVVLLGAINVIGKCVID